MILNVRSNIRVIKVWLLIAGCLLQAGSVSADIGGSMAAYLSVNVGTRVAGGECSQMATEALRVSGGEFCPQDLGADSPSSGDYVWGTLVTTISCSNKLLSDSNPMNKCLVGDIVQYRNATFTTSTGTVTASHHTSVVATVNTVGRATSIYQQNVSNIRTVQKATIDTTKLTAGWIKIYRPKAVVVRPGEWKTTVVNNMSANQSFTLQVGNQNLTTMTLTAASTATSYTVILVDTSGTVPDLLLTSGKSVFLSTLKGYQIPANSSPVNFAQLSQ